MSMSTTPNLEYATNIPAFLSKLWTLVEDEKNNELIAWDSVIKLLTILFKKKK